MHTRAMIRAVSSTGSPMCSQSSSPESRLCRVTHQAGHTGRVVALGPASESVVALVIGLPFDPGLRGSCLLPVQVHRSPVPRGTGLRAIMRSAKADVDVVRLAVVELHTDPVVVPSGAGLPVVDVLLSGGVVLVRRATVR